MFHEFFYLLRQYGLDVSLTEWMTFQKALSMGLHRSSMTGFFHLCRSILCKSETEYDKFEQAFLEYFHDVFFCANGAPRTELPDAFLDYLNRPERKDAPTARRTAAGSAAEQKDRMGEALDQSRHNDAVKTARTDDYIYNGDPFGDPGLDLSAIRVNRKPLSHSKLRAPKWDFRDFREDNLLSIRQFQMAFRRLCLYSDQFGQEEELDINRTVHDTCQKAGMLQVRYKKPRRNTIKVLMLIDSGGTMSPHSQLCSRLFQAASRSNRFKDLKIYYFHNCIDEYLYTNPTLRLKYEVSTQKVLRQCDKDYRVIIVGDAIMDINELVYPPAETTPNNLGFTGQDWFEHILSRHRYTVWLTPLLRKKGSFMGPWKESYDIITDLFDMYPLTVAGLDQAMKKLMSKS